MGNGKPVDIKAVIFLTCHAKRHTKKLHLNPTNMMKLDKVNTKQCIDSI